MFLLADGVLENYDGLCQDLYVVKGGFTGCSHQRQWVKD
jgi:hypothetical protein